MLLSEFISKNRCIWKNNFLLEQLHKYLLQSDSSVHLPINPGQEEIASTHCQNKRGADFDSDLRRRKLQGTLNDNFCVSHAYNQT